MLRIIILSEFIINMFHILPSSVVVLITLREADKSQTYWPTETQIYLQKKPDGKWE